MYIELFLLDNIIMNLLIFRLAGTLRVTRLIIWRAIVLSVAGSVIALAGAMGIKWLLSFPAKLAVCLAMAFALPNRSLRQYLINAFAMLAATFIAGGAAVAVTYLLGGTIQGGILVASSPVRVVMGTVLAVAFLPQAARRMLSRMNSGSVELRISHKGLSCRYAAMVDSGNLLVEPISGLPVVVIYDPKLRSLCDRVIPCVSVGGEVVLRGLIPHSIEVKTKQWTKIACAVAVSEHPIKNSDALLPVALAITE